MMTFKEQYYKIIQHRQANPLEDGVYGEKHHIYPKSLFPQFEHSDWNIVKLTPQEHYDCHELLVKWFEEEGDRTGYEKMVFAWNRISNSREGLVINAEQYAELREKFAAMCRETLRGQIPWNKGKNISDKHKQKISESRKGIPSPMKGKKCSDDTKRKISKTLSRLFEIDGIIFERQVDAAKHFGVAQGTISSWLNGKKTTDHVCKYIEKETVNG